MRSLVDQFGSHAEFPAARPRPADLNTIIDSALALFTGRLGSIRLRRRLSTGLPLVMADPEALKRAISNLIDNAAEAMSESLLRELNVSTRLLDNGTVELSVSDTGPGLTDEMRERLFLPYFSTNNAVPALVCPLPRRSCRNMVVPFVPRRTCLRVPASSSSCARFLSPKSTHPNHLTPPPLR